MSQVVSPDKNVDEPRQEPRRWLPMLDPQAAAASIECVRDIARRLRDPGQIRAAIAAAKVQTALPTAVHWQDFGVAQGYGGLAITCSALDECFPDDGWDRTGKDYLEVAVRSAETFADLPAGMCLGLAGLAFAAWSLSRNGSRYHTLLQTLDAALLPKAMRFAMQRLTGDGPSGVAAFDMISGLAGIGRYLLARAHIAHVRPALELVLRSLVETMSVRDELPGWRTPHEQLQGENWRRLYPSGNANCGLAHGIPGPLALLSIATACGISVDGQREAIGGVAQWLCRHRFDDRWGINWPSAVPLRAVSETAVPAAGPSRAAWCYGSPGVARALWLAGAALDDATFKDVALRAMEAVYRRPLDARHIPSPTFCHGVAGLLQITLRFAHDTRLPLFTQAARDLHRQIVDAFEPASILGYRNLEPGGTRVDHAGLLDGAPGVALVLMSAATPIAPLWDCFFLLS